MAMESRHQTEMPVTLRYRCKCQVYGMGPPLGRRSNLLRPWDLVAVASICGRCLEIRGNAVLAKKDPRHPGPYRLRFKIEEHKDKLARMHQPLVNSPLGKLPAAACHTAKTGLTSRIRYRWESMRSKIGFGQAVLKFDGQDGSKSKVNELARAEDGK